MSRQAYCTPDQPAELQTRSGASDDRSADQHERLGSAVAEDQRRRRDVKDRQRREAERPVQDILRPEAAIDLKEKKRDRKGSEELEADRDGTYLAVMAGYSPLGAVHLFERVGRMHREQQRLPADSPDQELSKVALAGIEGYFRSHPLPEERVNQIQRLIAARKWAVVPERSLQVQLAAQQTTAGNQ